MRLSWLGSCAKGKVAWLSTPSDRNNAQTPHDNGRMQRATAASCVHSKNAFRARTIACFSLIFFHFRKHGARIGYSLTLSRICFSQKKKKKRTKHSTHSDHPMSSCMKRSNCTREKGEIQTKQKRQMIKQQENKREGREDEGVTDTDYGHRQKDRYT